MKKSRTPFLFIFLTIAFAVYIHQRSPSPSQHIEQTNFEDSETSSVKNVLGTPLQVCSKSPMTGFLRDGSCHTNQNDGCRHVVCAEMTSDFLEYTKKLGNDLTSPNPNSRFPGLKEGDFWCLCVSRWMEAMNDGVPPPVLLHATHEETLKYISIEVLKKEAVYTKEF
jgi:uncharacterized protein (DUF2237 family)